MANSTETPAALFGDLRGVVQDRKRERDHVAKWSSGATIKGTSCGQTCFTSDGIGKIVAHNREYGIETRWKPHGIEDSRAYRPAVSNMYKTNSRRMGAPFGRVRNHMKVQEELHSDAPASLIDLLPTQRTGHGTVFDGVCNMPHYGDATSEDAAGPPAQALTLDIFVIESARGTEKLVEKEYEVLDANGDKVRGRKVRKVLRGAKQGDGKTGDNEVPAVEDDGFELV